MTRIIGAIMDHMLLISFYCIKTARRSWRSQWVQRDIFQRHFAVPAKSHVSRNSELIILHGRRFNNTSIINRHLMHQWLMTRFDYTEVDRDFKRAGDLPLRRRSKQEECDKVRDPLLGFWSKEKDARGKVFSQRHRHPHAPSSMTRRIARPDCVLRPWLNRAISLINRDITLEKMKKILSNSGEEDENNKVYYIRRKSDIE